MVTRVRTRAAAAVALALLVALAGCGGAGNAARGDGSNLAAESGGGSAGGLAGGAAKATASGGDSGGSSLPDVQSRRIVRTGHVTLEVEDFERARANLTRATERAGGFLSDSREEHRRVNGETYAVGEVVLRVPRGNFTALIDRVRNEGTVRTATTGSKDVTDQLVDLGARLKNLRDERDRLRALYRNASGTEDVLAVERRLSSVQSDIERLEARQKTLQRQVAYSTITVDLREPRPESASDSTSHWYDVPVLSAFLESVHGAGVALRALVVVLAYVLPYLLAFGLPLAAVGALLIGWRRGSLARFRR
ncbi:MAG: DUF4349 domain-containing protein [Salinigranum sp.]